MTQPLGPLAPQQVPRMQQFVKFRPTVFTGEINGVRIALLVIESANGTFTFTMPLAYLRNNLLPDLDSALTKSGEPSALAPRIERATTQDVVDISKLRGLNGRKEPT